MPLFVYITAPDMKTAASLAEMLVARRFAACVNLVSGMHSVYWWEGAVEHAEEVVLIAKTDDDRYQALEQAVLEAHPYECPCIVAMPIVHASQAYSAWITASTRMEQL